MKNKIAVLIVVMCTITQTIIAQTALGKVVPLAPFRCITAATISQTNITCAGKNDGTATVKLTAGPAPYTYSWAPSGGTAATASNLSPGTYTCTITDANNCVLLKTFTLTQPSSITAATTQTNVSCNGARTGTASITASGGTGVYTYSWAPSGGTASMASNLSAGNYTCTVKDANNCTLTKHIEITEPTATLISITHNNVSCNGANNGAAEAIVTSGIGPFSYAWTPGGSLTSRISNLSAGNYTCVITDGAACTISKAVTITMPPALTATVVQKDVACKGDASGLATVTVTGGTIPYTFSWSNKSNAATATNLLAGTYTCLITDANNCTLSKMVTITEPSNPISAITTQVNVRCNGENTGSASHVPTGGTIPYTFSWSTGSAATNITNLSAGSYSCTIKDANNCSITKVVSITEPAAITVLTAEANIACNGGNTGKASVAVSGGISPYTYLWSNDGTAASISNLSASSYSCTIKDANNCSITKVVSITEPAAINAITEQTNITCNGDNTGTAAVTVSGGTLPYTYTWSTGATTASISNLSAGSYSCTIKDANNCSTTKLITLTKPPSIMAGITTTDITCNGSSTGAASVTAIGGTPPFTYAWSTGATTSSVTNLASGMYVCTISDVNNCKAIGTFIISEPARLLVAIESLTQPGCEQSNGSVALKAEGGKAPYSYIWNNGYTGAALTNIAKGDYTCTVQDVNGCTVLFQKQITDVDPPTVTFNHSGNDSVCSKAGIITLTNGLPAGGIYTGTAVSTDIFDPAMAMAGWNIITYSYKNSSNCSGTAKDSIYVKNCSSSNVINANSEAEVIQVYPNPAYNQLIITYQSGSAKLMAVRLVNTDGRVIIDMPAEQHNSKWRKELNVSQYAKGVYFVQLITATHVIVKRLMVQ